MNRQILIIDDDENVRLGLRMLLVSEGYKVLEAKNGNEALALMEIKKPDVILCDVEMPIMDGFEFRRILLQNSEFSLIPFFFLTGHTSISETIYGLDLDADDYIQKNVNAAVLRKKIELAIKKRQLEQQAAIAALTEASLSTNLQLLPKTPPSIPGYLISQAYHAYRDTPGGDFFDYITISNDTTFVVIGDVMGKQWKAWMFAQAYIAYVRSTIRTLANIDSQKVTPAFILTQLNAILCSDEKTVDVLCTLAIAQLHHRSSDVLYASAAHVPALLLSASKDVPQEIDHGAAPIGHNPATQYTDYTFSMDHGDLLLLLTDGVTEASTNDDADYGEEQLQKNFVENRNDEQLAENLYRNALLFTGKNELDDDATIIVIRRNKI